jgi:hypothetical protein
MAAIEAGILSRAFKLNARVCLNSAKFAKCKICKICKICKKLQNLQNLQKIPTAVLQNLQNAKFAKFAKLKNYVIYVFIINSTEWFNFACMASRYKKYVHIRYKGFIHQLV